MKGVLGILFIALILMLCYIVWNKTTNTEQPVVKYIPIEKVVYKDNPIPKVIIVDVPSTIDTVAIVKEFYTRKYFSDTISIDTLGSATIEYQLYENSIDSLKLKLNLNYPQFPLYTKKYNYLVGVSYSIIGFNYSIGYTKGRVSYILGYTPSIDAFNIGVQFKF